MITTKLIEWLRKEENRETRERLEGYINELEKLPIELDTTDSSNSFWLDHFYLSLRDREQVLMVRQLLQDLVLTGDPKDLNGLEKIDLRRVDYFSVVQSILEESSVGEEVSQL